MRPDGGDMRKALNHMTVPNLGYTEFLDLAARLGCEGVEVRNDIARPLFDGLEPVEAGKIARDKGLRLVGLSQVYPFNDWDSERKAAVSRLISIARAAGAETISLIPRNDGTGLGNGERQANLRVALKGIMPLLQSAGLVALVEPLGFLRSSLRSKSDLVGTIESIGGGECFRIVHDTFHHTLAEGGPIFPDQTGIVHISGVIDPSLDVSEMEDEHRILVDDRDRLGNVGQIAALLAAGYDGPISMEAFSPAVHSMRNPEAKLAASFKFIEDQIAMPAE